MTLPEPRLGEFEGWKAVRLRRNGQPPFRGAHFSEMAYDYEATAECGVALRNRVIPHGHPLGGDYSCPDYPHIKARPFDCTCGFYAMKGLRFEFELAEALVSAATSANAFPSVKTSWSEFSVLARVSLWGQVVEATGGYRAQHQRIEELWVPKQIIPVVDETVRGRVPIRPLQALGRYRFDQFISRRYGESVWTSS